MKREYLRDCSREDKLVDFMNAEMRELHLRADDLADEFRVLTVSTQVEELSENPVAHRRVVGGNRLEDGRETGFMRDEQLGENVEVQLDFTQNLLVVRDQRHCVFE